MIDLRLGDWFHALSDVTEVDAVICDPPYSERTHAGQGEADMPDGYDRPEIPYAHWSPGDVTVFVEAWAHRCRGWMVCLTDHILYPAYRAAYEGVGRYAFPPIPCCIRGMTFRKSGDGPASQAVYAAISRPRSAEFMGGWARPGFYVANATDPGRMKGKRRKEGRMIGGKPIALMTQIVRDYSRPGELVVDPCSGLATTLIAAEAMGRRAVGAELSPVTHADALDRISKPLQLLRLAERPGRLANVDEGEPLQQEMAL